MKNISITIHPKYISGYIANTGIKVYGKIKGVKERGEKGELYSGIYYIIKPEAVFAPLCAREYEECEPSKFTDIKGEILIWRPHTASFYLKEGDMMIDINEYRYNQVVEGEDGIYAD